MDKYGDRIELIKSFSTQAVTKFKDYSIDFIYIDARHDYCSVLEELNNYYPKLKCNGIMAGHDYVIANQRNVRYEWRFCPNGTIVLKNSGSVKGKI